MKSNQLKKFDATQFEVLQTKGEVLKGGFSNALSTSNAGGISANSFNGYKCTVTNSGNCVKGCGGTTTPTTPTTTTTVASGISMG
ncbi:MULTISPECIES: hypothetical protein [Flavobacterium]|uniref:hypothetical protein n=1 Tax=Flavobacterium TaxID=237 RepID=UPI000868A9FE|nr:MULTISPECIES: hypothetical protein [Flavobacterium]MBN9284785.1 hypothetical protein [Flavobacterium sp.]ODS78919.1 MAG: hypothetical protein ABS44_21440 [Chryseobacterium sp. SCN 40-13]OJV71284.1 MAG: hypothetical protein BGO42_07645 [Flavobacterium sp. 40-81]